MSGLLLDTNVVGELRKGERMDAGLRTWWANRGEAELWLSVLVVGELRRGIQLLRRRDEQSAEALDVWLRGLVEEFADRLIVVDERVAETWGRLGVPDAVPVLDGLMAATAIVHDLILVTRNVSDVDRTGAEVINPFSATH